MIWTAVACSLGSGPRPGEEIVTVLGMPRWVFFGVVLPWVAACGFTLWFTMFYMKDTDLDPDRGTDDDSSQEPSQADS